MSDSNKYRLFSPEEKAAYAERKRQQVQDQLERGVREIFSDDQKFLGFIDTASHYIKNAFSTDNTILILTKNPKATHVMSYEQWKDFGRQVKAGEKGYPIRVPQFATADNLDEYIDRIDNALEQQLKSGPAGMTAAYQIGRSSVYISKIRSNTDKYCVSCHNTSQIMSRDQLAQFVSKTVLNRVPICYRTAYVFDISQTEIPEKLWAYPDRCTKDELCMGKNGQPIENEKGQYLIHNSSMRTGRFQPEMIFNIPENDTEKIRSHFCIGLVNSCKPCSA